MEFIKEYWAIIVFLLCMSVVISGMVGLLINFNEACKLYIKINSEEDGDKHDKTDSSVWSGGDKELLVTRMPEGPEES